MEAIAIHDQTATTPAITPKSPPSLAQRHKLRKAYIQGEGSLMALCRLHGLSHNTATTWSENEDWPSQRDAFEAKRRKELLTEATAPIPEPITLPQPDQQTTNPKLETLEKQLVRVDEALAECEDYKAWDALTRAKDRLMEHYYVLAGIPKPGSRRPGREGTKRVSVPLSPIEDAPTSPAV